MADSGFRTWLKAVGYKPEPGGKGTWTAVGPGWASASAAPGALFKFYASEGGTRVPLIVSGPGVAGIRGPGAQRPGQLHYGL